MHIRSAFGSYHRFFIELLSFSLSFPLSLESDACAVVVLLTIPDVEESQLVHG